MKMRGSGMRIATTSVICLLLACGTMHGPSFLREDYNSSSIQALCVKIEQWHLPKGMACVNCEVNAHGEGINLRKIDEGYQFDVAICGPNKAQHQSSFMSYAQEHHLNCGVLVGENLLSGCRESYVFQLECTSKEAAAHFSAMSSEIFGVTVSTSVIWKYSQ